jgi:hypothetical protein
MRVRRQLAKLLLLAVLSATPVLSSAAGSLPVSSSQTPSALLETQENLTTDPSPFDVALGGGYVFWTRTLGEFCSPPGSVKSVNLTTRVQATLISSCDISPANVVADDSHVYYADWLSDSVKRIPVVGGAPSTVVSADGLIYHRALALDDTYVYFGDNAGVNRVPKGGGSVVALAAGYDSYKLALDASYVYWTEWAVAGNDAIRRVPKTGGAVQTILSSGSLADPLGIAVDEAHVYWTEGNGGKVRRVAKAGGGILDLVPAQIDYWADSIAVGDEHVYWAGGTSTPGTHQLRRVPKGGGGIDDLVPGLSSLRGVNLSANYVYWGDWGGVWRLQVGPFKVYLPLIAKH